MITIPYGKQSITDDDIKAVVDVLKSDYLTQGPKIQEFEKKVADYHNSKYAVAFCNGTAALHAAYYALDVQPGDEVITSPITFVASANAAMYCGGIPRLVDIDMQTNCIDIEKIEEKIGDKTKVITPVAFAGYPVDLRSINTLAKKHECKVLYDAAHAIGSKRGGTFGMEYVDAAILSFHPVKHIATGEGGMVLTNNKDVYKKLLLFRTHGITKNAKELSQIDGPWYYEMVDLGFNYRMTDMQAALGISQLNRINDNLMDRKKIANFYYESFKEINDLILPPGIEYCKNGSDKLDDVHAFHLFTIRVKNQKCRSDLFRFLHSNGIKAQIHYIPIHYMPYYKNKFGYKHGEYPNSELYYETTISIPMFHNMKLEEMNYVVETIKKFYI